MHAHAPHTRSLTHTPQCLRWMLLYCSERVRRIVVHPTTRKLLKRAYKELLKERLTRYQTQVRGQSDKRSSTTPSHTVPVSRSSRPPGSVLACAASMTTRMSLSET